jgi:hypothetical protein
MTSFRCVGPSNVVAGKSSGINFCETIDKDGDKLLVRNIAEGPRNELETLVALGLVDLKGKGGVELVH